MNFTDFFKNFEMRNEKIDKLQLDLDNDYTNFVNENRKEIKKYLPNNGVIVKYIGDRKLTYNSEEWRYLKITDNRLIAKPEYRSYIPKIGVIPLDEDFKELKSYNERVAINLFELIDETKQKRADSVGYVYILNVTDTNIHKIGYSKKAKKRIDSIRTSSPLEIKLLKVYKCYSAYQVEQELHNIFKGKRTNREWFKLDLNDLDILENFITDFVIEESIEFPKDSNLKNKSELPLESYEMEKEDINNKFIEIMNQYIEDTKQVSLGNTITDSYEQQFIIEKISLWDKLESKDKKLFLSYGGYKVLKSGEKAKKYSPFISLKDKRLGTKLLDNKYHQDKIELLKEYKKLKNTFSKEFREFKKGDRVIDIFKEEYVVNDIEFIDSLEWKNKAYFTYGGRKVLENGKLSNKYSHLHKVRKI